MSNRTIEHLEIVADFLEQATDRDSYAVYVRAAIAELARLQAIVDGQPKTEDGIAPVIGQPLWALASDGDIIDGPMEGFDHFKGEIWFIIGRGPNRDYVAKRCNTYSIEALAAEAASK